MRIEDYKDSARVLVIDDELEEGQAIQSALNKKGVPSAFFHIQCNEDFPSNKLKNPRLVFLDFILESVSIELHSNEQKATHAMGNLEKFIGDINAYILIIWTSKTVGEIDEAIKEFKKKFKQYNVAKPLKIIVLQKSQCRSGTKPNYEYDYDLIQQKINVVLSGVPAFEIFSIGENLAINGISKSISSIVKDKSDSRLSALITALSKGYSGGEKEKERNALLNLSTIFQDEIEKEIISQGFSKLAKGKGLEKDNEKLNTSLIFLTDDVESSGVIYKLKLSLKQRRDILKEIIDQDELQINQEFKQFYIRKLEVVYVDVTPLCGSANSNGNRYFINGVLHPKRFKKTGKTKGEVKVKKDYGYQLQNNFFYKNAIYTLSFNLKSYCTDENRIKDANVILKFRSNIVIDIQHKIASYISRPGHTLLK